MKKYNQRQLKEVLDCKQSTKLKSEIRSDKIYLQTATSDFHSPYMNFRERDETKLKENYEPIPIIR